jgi:Uma2 family endonuclease
MATRTTPTMTAEEFFDWANRPENEGRRWELEDGKVVEMPSPAEIHGFVCWLTSMILGNYLLRRGAGYICSNDTGLVVRRKPDTVRGPDLMLFLESRPPEQMSRKFCDRVPALIVEVLSPSDTMKRTTVRVGQYLKRGVRLVWVLDPEEQSVYVHRPDEFSKVLELNDELTGNGALPDFSCRVRDLFTLPVAESQPTSEPSRPRSRKGTRE